jgi:hypothetical protein
MKSKPTAIGTPTGGSGMLAAVAALVANRCAQTT